MRLNNKLEGFIVLSINPRHFGYEVYCDGLVNQSRLVYEKAIQENYKVESSLDFFKYLFLAS